MELKRKGKTIRRYRVALGFSPERHKEREGDGRTPEGSYTVDARNPRSAFHLLLCVSNPYEDDEVRAASLGVFDAQTREVWPLVSTGARRAIHR